MTDDLLTPTPEPDEPEPLSVPKLTREQWDQLGYTEEEYRRNHPANAPLAVNHGAHAPALPPV